MNQPIYHLANPEDAEKLSQFGSYQAPSLDSEGFIHCCTSIQLPGVVQRYYANAETLVLLHIDAERLTAKLVLENTMGGSEKFPHVYGEINADAVTNAVSINREQISKIAASGEYLA